MSATTPDVPLHPHTDRWVFRSGGESGRVSRAERRGVYGDDEARRACADAGEKPDRPWHRTTSSSRILTLRSRRVKAFLSLGEFAHDATAGIFNDYVALQVWAGTPELQTGNWRAGLAPRAWHYFSNFVRHPLFARSPAGEDACPTLPPVTHKLRMEPPGPWSGHLGRLRRTS